MKTVTLETVRLDMPKADIKILKELAKRMDPALGGSGEMNYLCAHNSLKQKGSEIMAIAIAAVPVLKGTASERFEKKMQESETKRGKTDFSKQITEARKILAKAKIG